MEPQVIKVNALVFLFVVQFLLIFLGLTIFLFIRSRKINHGQGSYKDNDSLEGSVKIPETNNEEIAVMKGMLSDFQDKFEKIKNVNTNLKEAVTTLMPEGEGSGQYEQLLAEVEKNQREIELCIETLQRENEQLNDKNKSFEEGAGKLATKYATVLSEKTSLESRVEELHKELAGLTEANDKLKHTYSMLEKEYDALYKASMSGGG
jgi:uncharacterized phage infection (PIP) family protein YhgE